MKFLNFKYRSYSFLSKFFEFTDSYFEIKKVYWILSLLFALLSYNIYYNLSLPIFILAFLIVLSFIIPLILFYSNNLKFYFKSKKLESRNEIDKILQDKIKNNTPSPPKLKLIKGNKQF